jgi:hypothetical protein
MTMSIIGDLYEAARQLRICQRFGRLCGLSPEEVNVLSRAASNT